MQYICDIIPDETKELRLLRILIEHPIILGLDQMLSISNSNTLQVRILALWVVDYLILVLLMLKQWSHSDAHLDAFICLLI